jgi:quercetin dioxygenase-like cupin family protein
MEIRKKEPTIKGPGDWFTGDVYLDPVTSGLVAPSANIALIHFPPAARTAWHSHEGGQTLWVTEGRGLVATREGERAEIEPGDVVWAPDGEEHWHGAAHDHFMSHLSITTGAPAWGAQVTDEEYGPA